MRNAAAILVGFLIWGTFNVMFAIVQGRVDSVFIWERSPDRYASTALIAWLGSSIALAGAVVLKATIAPAYRNTAFIGTLGAVVLVSFAFAMIGRVGVDFEAVALAAHAVAFVIAFRMAKRSAPDPLFTTRAGGHAQTLEQAQTLARSFAAFTLEDYQTARTGFKKLADQGIAEAQFALGGMYAHGQGVPQDEQHGVAWFRKAADQGYALAQTCLGLMYVDGRGVPKDEQQAVAWFRKAAEQGDADAQFNLGVRYGDGRGVPKDDGQAAAWYRKAAEQGQAPKPPTLQLRSDPLATEKLADEMLQNPRATERQKAAARKLKASSIALQIAMMARDRKARGLQSGVVDKGPGARTPVPKPDSAT